MRRLVARAEARNLSAFVVPGLERARAGGLDLAAAGLRVVASPRRAGVLVLVGELPPGLASAAAIVFAQMPRPRTILAVGCDLLVPFPSPDVSVALDQSALQDGVRRLRRLVAEGAFSGEAADFDPAIRTVTDFTCPMHPEVAQDRPGTCPLCGMALVPRETLSHPLAAGAPSGTQSAHTGHGDHAARAEHQTSAPAMVRYTCPMHPEVVEDRPGECPICGMALVPRETSGGVETGGAPEREHTQDVEQRQQRSEGALREHGGHGGTVEQLTHGDHGTHGDHASGLAATVTTYTCPMHPEVVQPEPGACPICGMALVPREPQGTQEHPAAHVADERAGPGADHAAAGHHAPAPPHPEITPHPGHGSAEETVHGSQSADSDAAHHGKRESYHATAAHGVQDHAPNHHPESTEHEGHGDMLHGAAHPMDHGGHAMPDGFMSMVAMTKDLPRSPDGLPMERSEVPFGPLFPGLPGGLDLRFTLDGDAVAEAHLVQGAAGRQLAGSWPGPVATFPDRLARLDPLAPVAYRLLAQQAMQDAAGIGIDRATAHERVAALERQRVASHLNWLAGFAGLLGDRWLAATAAALQRTALSASSEAELGGLADALRRFTRRLERTPLLGRRLAGVGQLGDAADALGPLARGAGFAVDARAEDPWYRELGFAPVVAAGGDALGRLEVRLGEAAQSLCLVHAVGPAPSRPGPVVMPADLSGEGSATLETPRGAASLHLAVERGTVHDVHVTTPSTANLTFVPRVAEGREVTAALVGVASLDLSPWEYDR